MVGAILTNESPVTLDQVTPIARLTGEYEAIVVPAASEIKDMAGLVDKLKADPGSVSWAGGSAGGTDHITAGLIAKAVGVDPTKVNYIAFSGGGEALAAILGNQVTVGISGYGEFAEQIKAGALRLLGISSDERVAGVDAPTFKEAGVDVVDPELAHGRRRARHHRRAEGRHHRRHRQDGEVGQPGRRRSTDKGWAEHLSRR